TLAATSASVPIGGGSPSLPAASMCACANAQATSASATAMPSEPIHSSGLRPIRSTSATVTRPAAMAILRQRRADLAQLRARDLLAVQAHQHGLRLRLALAHHQETRAFRNE